MTVLVLLHHMIRPLSVLLIYGNSDSRNILSAVLCCAYCRLISIVPFH